MKENKIIVSTDIGSDPDDALSILAMLNNNLNVRAVHTVNGNVNARSYIARHLLNLAGRKDVKVARGPSESLEKLIEPFSYLEDCYIEDSFIDEKASEEVGDITFKPLHRVGIMPHARIDLASRLFKDKYTLFSLGPLTLIAQLIEQHPELIANIERVYVMGGRFQAEALEHNFRFDPLAAQKVCDSDLPLTIVCGDVCESYRLPLESLDQLASPAGRYARRMAAGYAAAKTAEEFIYYNEGISRSLLQLLQDKVKTTPLAARELGKRESYELQCKKDSLLVNIDDPIYAAFEPAQYTQQYSALMGILREPKGYFEFAASALHLLETIGPKTLSLADVFVPYCFLYPDHLSVRKGSVKVSLPFGQAELIEGDKHEIVTGIDVDHFKEFVSRSLR
ncbi:MAG: nucleoside hydrolase [Nanoarchaeota archaeon]|nr:nucleoside hydrolase [Nanoarchaeota archaeon]